MNCAEAAGVKGVEIHDGCESVVKDVKSNVGMVADEAGLVTLGETRVLSQSPKRCFEEGRVEGFWLSNEEFREETILLVSEIVLGGS